MADAAALHAELKGILRAAEKEVDRVGGLPAKAVLARMAQDFMAFVGKMPDETGAPAAAAPVETAPPHTHESIVAAAAEMPVHVVARLIGDLKRMVRSKPAVLVHTPPAVTDAPNMLTETTETGPAASLPPLQAAITDAPPEQQQDTALGQQQSAFGPMTGQQQTGVNQLNDAAPQQTESTI